MSTCQVLLQTQYKLQPQSIVFCFQDAILQYEGISRQLLYFRGLKSHCPLTVYNISMKKRSYPQGKVKAIAKAYIKNKFNGAATGMEVYNTTNRNSAKRMISKALKSPEVKNAIQEELAAVGITREYINKQMYKAIDKNIELGKPSQAVGAQLLIQAQKIYN